MLGLVRNPDCRVFGFACGLVQLLVFENGEYNDSDDTGDDSKFDIPTIFSIRGNLKAENSGPKNGYFKILPKSRIQHGHLTDDMLLFFGGILAVNMISWLGHFSKTWTEIA